MPACFLAHLVPLWLLPRGGVRTQQRFHSVETLSNLTLVRDTCSTTLQHFGGGHCLRRTNRLPPNAPPVACSALFRLWDTDTEGIAVDVKNKMTKIAIKSRPRRRFPSPSWTRNRWAERIPLKEKKRKIKECRGVHCVQKHLKRIMLPCGRSGRSNSSSFPRFLQTDRKPETNPVCTPQISVAI